jgi:hypothetical protein
MPDYKDVTTSQERKSSKKKAIKSANQPAKLNTDIQKQLQIGPAPGDYICRDNHKGVVGALEKIS